METPKKQTLKLVIFDLDGTLADTREDLSRAVNHALVESGHPEKSLEEVTAAVGHGAKKLVSRCVPPGLSEAQEERVFQSFYTYYGEHCCPPQGNSRLYPGVTALLESLKQLHLAVLTNKPHHFSVKILEALKVAAYFDWIMGGDTAPEKKPGPGGLKEILRRCGVKPREALFVGDSDADVLAGKAAGVPTVGLLNGMGDPHKLKQSGPDALLPDIASLENWLQKDYILN